MIRNKRDEMHLRPVFQQDFAFFGVQGFERVVAALGIVVRFQCFQFRRAALRVENEHAVHEPERGQQIGTVVSAVDGPSGSFERTDRFIGIEQDQQGIGGFPCRQQVFGMAPVEDVETAVGDGETAAVIPQGAPPLDRLVQAAEYSAFRQGKYKKNRSRGNKCAPACNGTIKALRPL